jgi:hypothetical protein
LTSNCNGQLAVVGIYVGLQTDYIWMNNDFIVSVSVLIIADILTIAKLVHILS